MGFKVADRSISHLHCHCPLDLGLETCLGQNCKLELSKLPHASGISAGALQARLRSYLVTGKDTNQEADAWQAISADGS